MRGTFSSLSLEKCPDDFVWSNDRFNWVVNKQDTIDWCKSTNLIGIDFSAYYENDEVLVVVLLVLVYV